MDAVRLGDIVYMPPEPGLHQIVGAFDAVRDRASRFPEPLAARLAAATNEFQVRIAIENAANDAAWTSRGDPPDWFAELPGGYRESAARAWAVHVLENPNILLGFAYAGIGGYAVDLDDGSMLGEAYRLFDLHRLGGIRQLAWLTTPVLPQDQPDVIPTRFEHNRLNHVWDVAAIANLLACGIGLERGDAATLVLAAATHDARTPAGGDTTKLLDPAFFDEDARYPELLARDDMRVFLTERGIEVGRLAETIMGRGLLGELLDVADKTAYVARDAFWFHFRFRNGILDCEEGDAIHDLLRRHPEDACSAWQSVIRDGDRIAFTDAEALARLLRLRALLFRALYFHPGSRFAEFVMSHVILRHLVGSGKIRKESLLDWHDDRLDDAIKGYLHPSIGVYIGEPVHEGFDDEASAEERATELRAEGETLVMVEKLPTRIKSGTHFLVSVDGQGPRPLKDAAPELADPIDALAMVVHPFRLYWVPYGTLAPKFRKLVELSLAAT